MSRLFINATIAVLALPGVVAFLVPLSLLVPGDSLRPVHWWGLVVVALGTALLAACVREFYVAGRGTLAPWQPPQALVVSGPYRRSRNPMYVGVVIILAGWAITYASPGLALYAVVILTVFHLRILWYEEPRLAAGSGDEWSRYRDSVRRWL